MTRQVSTLHKQGPAAETSLDTLPLSAGLPGGNNNNVNGY